MKKMKQKWRRSGEEEGNLNEHARVGRWDNREAEEKSAKEQELVGR